MPRNQEGDMGSTIGRIVLGVVVLVLGFLCLNYTNGFGISHHIEWAKANGAPAPSYPIFVMGAVLEALGAAICGHALGGRRRLSAKAVQRGP